MVHAEYEPYDTRYYPMFYAMAGIRRVPCFEQLFKPRELPGDITQLTYDRYIENKCEYHTRSWLTTEELKECIDSVKDISIRIYHDDLQTVDDYLGVYCRLYQYMKELEDRGEPARIVFWFDN